MLEKINMLRFYKRKRYYVSKAHAMIIERQKVEELRRRACEERSEKKAIAELKKVHKQTKKWRKNWQKDYNAWKDIYG